MNTPPFAKLWAWIGGGLALTGLVAFIALTPPGVLTMADYVGAAVCHRLPEHTFHLAGRPLPLCQRCSGMFPGALTGLLVHWGLWRRRRARGFPRWPLMLAAGLGAATWVLDGFNSFTSDPRLAGLLPWPEGVGIFGYAPQPWLRLLTGALMGVAMSILLVPAFNQSFWADAEDVPTVRSWSELAFLNAVVLAMAAIIFLARPWLLVPIALYSAAGVMTLFTLLGAMLFVIVLRRDATLQSWREAWVPCVWGLVFALAVVGGMNLLRWFAIGTVDGVPGL